MQCGSKRRFGAALDKSDPDFMRAETMKAGAQGGIKFSVSDRGQATAPAWSTGVEEVDFCLPESGLALDGLHEVEPLRPTDMPCLFGFSFALLARLRSTKPIIWCVTANQVGDYGQPYAFGLQRYGIAPSQIIFAKVGKQRDLPFALEEALKTDGIAAVIGEGERPSFTGSRRLSLLCREHQTPCLLMTPEKGGGNGSAALTRWQIAPQKGAEDPRDPYGPGLLTWAVALPRVRHGKTMPDMHENQLSQQATRTQYPWRIVWDEQAFSFRPASVFANRAFHQSAAPPEQPAKAVLGRTG